MSEVVTIGVDLAKNVFQVHGVDAEGGVAFRRQLRRRQVLPFFKKQSPCRVGMEACATSHHWAREIEALGHEVRLPEVAFAFYHMFGFDQLPRLKAISRQKLYLPDAGKCQNYGNLESILTRPIDWRLIEQQYDEIVKFAAALKLGTAEPEAILRCFHSLQMFSTQPTKP